MDHIEYLKKAYDLAVKAKSENEVPIGSLLVLDGKVVSEAYNQKESQFDPTSHAEVNVIRKAGQTLKRWRHEGSILYTTLEPCLMCLVACQQARISKVIYGAKDPKGGAISLGYEIHKDSKFNHEFDLEYVEYAPCSEILSDFFRNKRAENKAKS